MAKRLLETSSYVLEGRMQSIHGAAGKKMIRVLVADDTRIHTQLLADALRRDRDLEVISPMVHSRDLVETAKLQEVEVVVLSSNLDEEPLRGFELLRQLRASQPGIVAVMLLESSKRDAVLQAFRSGARGIFSRHDSLEMLSKCIRSVRHGEIWATSQQMAYAVEALESSPMVRTVDSNGLSLLSKRELEVVRSLAEGLTNREIAVRLGLSQHTIKNYLFRIYDKMGVSSRIELLFMTLHEHGSARAADANAGIAHETGYQNLTRTAHRHQVRDPTAISTLTARDFGFERGQRFRHAKRQKVKTRIRRAQSSERLQLLVRTHWTSFITPYLYGSDCAPLTGRIET